MIEKKNLRSYFTQIYYSTKLGRALIHPFIELWNKVLPEDLRLKIRFKRMLGYSLNLKKPKTFNEKIQWLKLNDRSDLHTICADKFRVREYVKTKVDEKHLIPLFYFSPSSNDIKASNLPDFPVIIKTNHGSGSIYIVKDKNGFNFKKLRGKLKKQLKESYSNSKGEWQYKNIKPMILVEKLLIDKNGNIPSDYKLHCFNGRVKIIQIHTDRFTRHKISFYSAEWSLLPIRRQKIQNEPNLSKPRNLSEMINIAEKLASDFLYVRVDLYNVNNHIYFGELTFHPASGFGKFVPEIWDMKLGDMLTLPISE